MALLLIGTLISGCHTYPLPSDLYRRAPDEQIRLFDRAIELEPDVPEFRYEQALVLHQEGMLRKAIRRLEQAIEMKSDYGNALLMLGRLYKQLASQRDPQKDPSPAELLRKALQVFEEAAKCVPNDSESLFLLGQTHLDLGEPEFALSAFGQITQPRSLRREAAYQSGLVLIKLEKYDEARLIYLQLLEEKDTAKVHEGLGLTYLAQNNAQQALVEFQQSAELEDEHAWPHIRRAQAYLASKNNESAFEALQQATGLLPQDDPQDPKDRQTLANHLYLMAHIYHVIGTTDQAYNNIRRSIGLFPTPIAYRELANIEKEQGNVDESNKYRVRACMSAWRPVDQPIFCEINAPEHSATAVAKKPPIVRLVAPEVAPAPRVDGKLRERSWETAQPVALIPASEQSISDVNSISIKICHSRSNLYVGGSWVPNQKASNRGLKFILTYPSAATPEFEIVITMDGALFFRRGGRGSWETTSTHSKLSGRFNKTRNLASFEVAVPLSDPTLNHAELQTTVMLTAADPRIENASIVASWPQNGAEGRWRIEK